MTYLKEPKMINAKKPHITPLRGGGWICRSANLGGTAWSPTGAYRAWVWNMLHNSDERRLREYGFLPPNV